MAILKIKDETGKFVDIPAIQGAPGKDGAIQYEAGEGIKIDGNVISADNTDILNLIGDATPDVPLIHIADTMGGSSTSEAWALSSSNRTKIIEAINKSRYSKVLVLITCTESYRGSRTYLVYVRVNRDSPVVTGWYSSTSYGVRLDNTSTADGVFYRCAFNTSYSTDGNGSITSLSFNHKNTDLLYATQQFVNDRITAAITTVLESEY